MSDFPELPVWAAAPAAVLLVCGGLATLIGSIGLLRLPTFFARMHGPSMGATLGAACVLTASVIVSSALAHRPVVHELLIVFFLVMSSPVTSMMLMQAAAYRNRARGRE
jgi:multicomponent K+:H+ antiporter subunit G